MGRQEMSEINEQEQEQEKKPLGLSSRPNRLELKKTVETGQVRQSFSHGRSKMVQVEVRKKRTFARDAGGRMAEVKPELARLEEPQEVSATERIVPYAELEAQARRPGVGHLTNEERAARLKALEDARKAFDEVMPSAAEPAEPAPALTPQAQAAALEAQRRAEELALKEAGEAEAKRRAEEEETRKRVEEQAKAAAAAAALKLQALEEEEPEEEKKGFVKGRLRPEPRRPTLAPKRLEPRRRLGKLTIAAALGADENERVRSLASVRRQREREKLKQQAQAEAEPQKFVRDVVIPESITVQELANRMAERGGAVIKELIKMGVMATINQAIDADTAELVVREFGHAPRRVSEADVEIGLKRAADDPSVLKPRPPVVTVMGHVDHGKTSLLDALRQTDVAAHEAGGITQHIGAYQVTTASGAKITFIDTPGHAAFTEMRARGARVTDIVVLVVAADDGIMPQTIEAINHAKAAGVPLVVAINKIDRPDADPRRVRTELLQHGLVVEELGGEMLAVDVSAKEKRNLDKLEEAILLQAEILDLRANPEGFAEGVIVEAKMELGRGSVATVLVQRGTLNLGDTFVAGSEYGRVRALVDAHGQAVERAAPGLPVEIVGLNGTPAAGDELIVVDGENRAREIAEFRQRRRRQARAATTSRSTLEQMFQRIQEGEAKVLPVVIKADVHGSVEAIQGALEKISTDEVKVQVLHAAVGGINESDVTLARASSALIIGFNVRANPQAREMARRDEVEISYYSIIYDVTEDIKKALAGLLAPKFRERILGYAEVREVFTVSKVGKVAGCMVTEGTIKGGAKVRLLRDDVVVHEGQLSQLKRFKDDAKEVKEGLECGMAFANFQDIQKGDRVECLEIEEIARALA
jgi:translation initiation factor IF-2